MSRNFNYQRGDWWEYESIEPALRKVKMLLKYNYIAIIRPGYYVEILGRIADDTGKECNND